jgi:hypothetical protein
LSIIPPISIKGTITSPQLIEHKKNTTTYNIENLGPGLGQAHTCGRVKPMNGSWMNGMYRR